MLMNAKMHTRSFLNALRSPMVNIFIYLVFFLKIYGLFIRLWLKWYQFTGFPHQCQRNFNEFGINYADLVPYTHYPMLCCVPITKYWLCFISIYILRKLLVMENFHIILPFSLSLVFHLFSFLCRSHWKWMHNRSKIYCHCIWKTLNLLLMMDFPLCKV